MPSISQLHLQRFSLKGCPLAYRCCFVAFSSVRGKWCCGQTPAIGPLIPGCYALLQVSFVNAICTTKGGTHVNYVMDQVTKYLVELVTKKDKKVEKP